MTNEEIFTILIFAIGLIEFIKLRDLEERMGTYIFLKDADGERVPAYYWEDMKSDSLKSYRTRLKPGWAIVCDGKEEKEAALVNAEEIEAMQELEKVGIITDFRYDLDGAFPGLTVLRVTEIKGKTEPLELTAAEAMEILETYDQSEDNDDEEFKAAIRKALEALKQKQKTGHWILAGEQSKEDIENDNYRFTCSECWCSDIHAKGARVPYCWKCGAKMKSEEQEEQG